MNAMHRPVQAVADGAATAACDAVARAVGLLELIDRFRFRDVSDPIPAPGAYELPDAARGCALDAIHYVGLCRIVGDDPQALARAANQAVEAARDAEAALRHLAQIGLGVGQHANDGADVELLERAMMAVLDVDELACTAAADRFPLRGRTRFELSVELAGLVARMLCDAAGGTDGNPQVVLAAPGAPERTITIDGGDIVVDGFDRFEGPVTITDLTEQLLDAYTEDGVVSGGLELRWP